MEVPSVGARRSRVACRVACRGPETDRGPSPPVRRGGPRRLVPALVVLVLVAVTSCSGLGYYGQAIWGQTRLMAQRRPIDRLLRDPRTDPQLRARLATVARIRDFAVAELALPDNGSYRSYVEIDREHVVWNVFAAPELSLEPVTWCFPVAGCVAYRGYFDEARARRFAAQLTARGFDVDVGGVDAYSTLGWFKDPVLSTVIDYPDAELAGLVFHELTHQLIYVRDDSRFNESLATTVELEGVRRWLRDGGDGDRDDGGRGAFALYRELKERQAAFVALVLAYRDRLAEVYAAAEPEEWKRRRKREILAELRGANRDPGYDEWFAQDLNNAHLVSMGAYYDLVPAFQALLARQGGDLEAFYAAVRELAGLEPEERERRM